MKRHEQFAAALVNEQGKDKAIQIVTDCLNIAQRSATITFFDEADFTVNDQGKYEFAKVQSDKTAKRKNNRINSTRNFYALVLQILNRK